MSIFDLIFPWRRIVRLEQRLDRLIKAVPGLKEPPSTLPGDQYTYGTWRGHPARRNERTGYREHDQHWQFPELPVGSWSTLGLGYENEFIPYASKRTFGGWLRDRVFGQKLLKA